MEWNCQANGVLARYVRLCIEANGLCASSGSFDLRKIAVFGNNECLSVTSAVMQTNYSAVITATGSDISLPWPVYAIDPPNCFDL